MEINSSSTKREPNSLARMETTFSKDLIHNNPYSENCNHCFDPNEMTDGVASIYYPPFLYTSNGKQPLLHPMSITNTSSKAQENASSSSSQNDGEQTTDPSHGTLSTRPHSKIVAGASNAGEIFLLDQDHRNAGHSLDSRP